MSLLGIVRIGSLVYSQQRNNDYDSTPSLFNHITQLASYIYRGM